ncbi:enoyl-CoA delta isomerase 1, peroxisomal [Ricinus communis]|uniref:enoyl-CoA delta isomerase 1, peroxisomal n=1 Tax=Ricinus communis TaxID=3988 RepID=UPI00201AA684|nr:enoyl-CoA delta isomerase 1, peroxisomal [Ricinus communis]
MCTLEKRGNIYILTLIGTNEHRLNPNLLNSLESALRRLKSEPASPSSVLITTAHGKFFSNGYDLAWTQSSKSRRQLLSSKFRSLISSLIALPMPTIAAVTGHASAAGFILAISHDFVLMRKDRGFLYMSEVDIGLVIPEWFNAILKCKIGDYNVRRDVVLIAEKLTAKVALEKRIIHSAHDSAESTVDAAVVLAEELIKRKRNGHVYGNNRLVVLSEVLDKIGFDESVEGQNWDNGKSKL